MRRRRACHFRGDTWPSPATNQRPQPAAARRAGRRRAGATGRARLQQGAGACRLPRHAADPPLRGEGRPDVRHGADRRLLPPLYRPGSGRRRHADGDQGRATQVITGYRDHGHMLACGMDPKGVMAELTGRRGGYSKGKGGSMHMFSAREGLLRRPRHRRRAGAARHRPRLRQPIPRQRQRLRSPISATAPPTRARSTRASTWRSSGSCRWSTSSRTTSTAWAPRSRAPRRPRISPSAGCSFDIPGEQVDGMDVRAVKAAGEKAVAVVPRRQRADHPGNADLPLSRPLDVGPGQVPLQGRGRQGAHRARSDRAGARAAAREEMGERGRAEEDRRSEVRAVVNEAAEFATHDAEPDPSELYTDV